jgi:membrane associated rhomboid family serine protease
MFPLSDHNPSSTTPYVTCLLIAINSLVMLWLATLGPLERQEAAIEHGFIPVRVSQLVDPRPIEVQVIMELPAAIGQMPGQQVVKKIDLPASPPQILASVLTTMFMHGGWMHLLGNMWFLWIFGNNIEDRLGHFLYFGFYLVGGLLATMCHWAYDPMSTTPVVGASGAVAAILGAYAVTFPKAMVSTVIFFGIITVVQIPALVWLGLWLLGQLAEAFFNRDLGVAVWAHIGGFAAGAFLMPILSFGSPPPGSNWQEELKKHFSMTPSDWH